MDLTYDQTLLLLVVVLCLVIIGALGLIIYLIHRVNRQNDTIGCLLTRMDKIEKTISYQAYSIQFITSTVRKLESRMCGTHNNTTQGYPQDGYTRTGFGCECESAKGVNPV